MACKVKIKPKTRKDTCCPIFGPPAELHTNILPTLGTIQANSTNEVLFACSEPNETK